MVATPVCRWSPTGVTLRKEKAKAQDMATRRQEGDALTRRTAAWLVGASLAAAASSARAFEVAHGTSASRLDLPDYQPPANIAVAEDIYRRMTAPVRINGQGPFPFVVDTGANRTVICAELAAKLNLPVGAPAALNGVAGVRLAPTTTARLDIGRHGRREATLSVLSRADLGAIGLLGLEDLDGQAVTLNFRSHSLLIEPGRRAAQDSAAVAVKARRRSGQLTLVNADLGGSPITAFLDSGAQNTIGNLALRGLASTLAPQTSWSPTPIISVTGQTVDAEMAALPLLRIGGLRLVNWKVAFADLHTFRLWDLIDGPAILLGVDVLSRFEYVCLDFARDEVRFRLPPAA